MKSLLGNMLAGKRITSARDGIIGAGCESKKKKKTHPLTNFEIQKYCQNKPRFNGVYFRDELPGKFTQ